MNAVDRFLQRWRIQVAASYVRAGDRLLDIGCYDGALIKSVRSRISGAVGIDPLAQPAESNGVTILKGAIPGDVPLAPESFDCVTMLATLEHVDDPAALSRACFRLLKPGGRLILTVPHAIVDVIVHVMVRLRIAHGMDFEAHHGFDVRATEPTFTQAGFHLVTKRIFELGLNRLYVFEKPAGSS